LSGSIADAINIAEVGAFDREEWKGISEKEVTKRGLIGETLSGAFEDGFLTCPQAGESHVDVPVVEWRDSWTLDFFD